MQQDRNAVRTYPARALRSLVAAIALAGVVVLTGACSPRPLVAFSEQFETPSTVRLVVLVDDGAVAVREGPSGVVTVSGEHPEDVHQYSGTVAAGEARIELRRRRGLDMRIGQRGAHIEVQVPPGSTVEVDASNGAVEVEGAFEVGRVKATNGEVRVSGGRGALTIEADNGRTLVERHAGPLTVRAANGRIDVTDQRSGAVALTSSNGPIRYEGTVEALGDNSIETSNGVIEVVVQGTASFMLDASTSNGGVTCRFAVLDGAKGDTKLTGRVGDGTAKLVLRSSNGAIEVR